MADAFSSKGDSIVKIGFAWVARSSRVQQGLACVKQKRYIKVFSFACFFERNKLLFVKANVVGAVFGTHEIKS